MEALLIDPLIESAYACPSLGLMYVAAVLEENDVRVSIVETRFLKKPWSDLRDIVSSIAPDIVGVTATSYTFPDAIKAIRTAKSVNSDILAVIGGPHVTFTPKETLTENPDIDAVVMGEGEYTMLELVKVFGETGRIGEVAGIAFKREKDVVIADPRLFIKDLDMLPFPARHLVAMERYKALEGITTLITSRGCPFECVYCASRAMWGSIMRLRSPANVVDEMEYIAEKYGFHAVSFADDVFTINRRRVVKICDEISRQGLDVQWECSTRVDLLTKDLLRKMKRAGCRAIFLGIESGCQEVLDRVKKGIRVEQAKRVVRCAKDVGVETRLSFILGCPGENVKTVTKTIRFAKELHKLGANFISFSLLKVYPGSELAKRPEEFGIIYVDKDWGRKFGAPLTPTCESWDLAMSTRLLLAAYAAEVERECNRLETEE